jgi:hypothetical protein
MRAILAFLRTRPELGARPRDITEHCIGLIRAGTLIAAVSSDDRTWVDKSVWQSLDSMRKSGKVAKTPAGVYRITDVGLAWLERYLSPAPDIRNPDETSPRGEPESSGR